MDDGYEKKETKKQKESLKKLTAKYRNVFIDIEIFFPRNTIIHFLHLRLFPVESAPEGGQKMNSPFRIRPMSMEKYVCLILCLLMSPIVGIE